MSKLMELNDGVSLRCREELKRLGIKGVDFVRKTGLLKQTFSAVFNGVNSAPTGFISALCTHYPADVLYIITGVRSSTAGNTAPAGGYNPNAVAPDGYAINVTRPDDKEKEIGYLKELIKSRDREIANMERVISLLTERTK